MKNFSRNSKKRLTALLLSALLFVASSMSVFAVEDTYVGETDDSSMSVGGEAGITSVGSLIDSGTNVISGYGTITLHLTRSYYKPYFRAMAAGNANVGVHCTVTLPNGRTETLGTITADGSKTSYLPHTGFLPAGDYVFRFQCTNTSTIAVAAFIYSNY